MSSIDQIRNLGMSGRRRQHAKQDNTTTDSQRPFVLAERAILRGTGRPALDLLAVVLILCVPLLEVVALAANNQPNIVLILTDDMGFSDLGCYGGEIATPNLDGLAANGLRFTQFYNTARCCPTRASLLTGLYPHQAGMGHMTGGKSTLDGYAGNLNHRCVTIAEALKPAGYRAYVCGKWHVARSERKPDDPKDTWPMQRGFDKFYGTITGAGSFYDPSTLCRGNQFITPENDEEYRPRQFYYTDAISDNALKFLQEHARDSADRPFFLYVAYTAAHWPMHALPEDIAKYKGKYDVGYGVVRQTRWERAKRLGVISPGWELAPQAEDWDKVTDKLWEARCMEVYAGMVDRMDQGVGRIVAELKRQGKFENTLLFYLQDNGGCAETVGRQSNAEKLKGFVGKPFGPNDLQPQSSPPMQTRDGRPVRTGPGVMPGPEDTYVACGRGWANVQNTPFREYKHWEHEGGISTPLIVHWPAGIPAARHNTLIHQPGHLIDIMATCLDVAGAKPTAERDNVPIPPPEGVSLRPAFEGKSLRRAGPLFFEHEGNRAVRDGRWKLVAKGPAGKWELYDMEADRTEMHDLASSLPDRVKTMSAQWDAWAQRVKAMPWPWREGADDKKAEASLRTRFELKADTSLDGEQRPNVAGRAFRIEVVLAETAQDGVLVAQGGTAHGFSLYFKAGALCFATRRAGTLETVSARHDSLATARTLSASLARDGTVRLLAEGKAVATGKTAGPIAALPADGLQVGRDERGAVGDYTAPFAFRGRIESALLVLE